jgi:hypothetical protein
MSQPKPAEVAAGIDHITDTYGVDLADAYLQPTDTGDPVLRRYRATAVVAVDLARPLVAARDTSAGVTERRSSRRSMRRWRPPCSHTRYRRRPAMSPEREQFLDNRIVTLIENFGTLSWFRTDDYDCPEDRPVTATIVDDDGTHHEITRDTMNRGIR